MNLFIVTCNRLAGRREIPRLATNLNVRRSESENLEWPAGITAESMHGPVERTVLHVHTANGDWLHCPQPTPPRPPKHPLQWTVLHVPVFPLHADGASVTLFWGPGASVSHPGSSFGWPEDRCPVSGIGFVLHFFVIS